MLVIRMTQTLKHKIIFRHDRHRIMCTNYKQSIYSTAIYIKKSFQGKNKRVFFYSNAILYLNKKMHITEHFSYV